MDDILQQLGKVISDWNTVGALAGLIALVNLLVQLTKLHSLPGFLGKAMAWIKPSWRPYLAIGLGMLGGFLVALQQGKSWGAAVVGGIITGLGAIGGHEAITQAQPSEKARKEAASAVEAALTGERDEVKAKVDAMKAELDKVVALPDKKARLKALADLANAKAA